MDKFSYMFYPDLSPCDIWAEDASKFRAVGWLSEGEPFTVGKVDEAILERLCELLIDPWNPAYSAGIHCCELCLSEMGNSKFNGFTLPSASAWDLCVPGDGVIYIAPSSIAHYIHVHSYRPPEEFCQAVLECPPMRSISYFKAILKIAGREWLNFGDEGETA